MMKIHTRPVICTVLCVSVLLSFTLITASCTSSAEETEVHTGTAPAEEAQERPDAEAPEPEKPEKEPEPKKEEAEVEGGSYEMDEQEYEETKRDLSELVSDLNEIIAARNYSRWLNYLTEEYKEYYGDPEVLKDYSDAPVLKKYDINLRSLKDYFNYVVVASRRNVKVDDIQAIGPDKVKAYMYVDGNAVVVYTLEKVDGKWKITK